MKVYLPCRSFIEALYTLNSLPVISFNYKPKSQTLKPRSSYILDPRTSKPMGQNGNTDNFVFKEARHVAEGALVGKRLREFRDVKA